AQKPTSNRTGKATVMSSFPRFNRYFHPHSCTRQLLAGVNRVVLAVVLMFFAAATAHAGTTYSWAGAASDQWTNPNNWNPVGVPSSGDSVAFPSGAANLTNTNDLVGLSLTNIAFNGCCYTVGGNGVVLTNSLSSVSSGNVVN